MVGLGRLIALIHVFEVGMKEEVTSKKLSVGCTQTPSTGSSSAQVPNSNTF